MGETYRVLVTGSRDWADEKRIHGALDALLAQMELEPRRTLIIVHGACPKGTDEIARKWALDMLRHGHDVRTEPHPADWRPDGVFDRTAGFRRNAAMVALGADLALAWIMPCSDQRCRIAVEHGSHGATHCADLARKAGIPVREFRSDQ